MDDFDDPSFDAAGLDALAAVEAQSASAANTRAPAPQPTPQKVTRPGTNSILVNPLQAGNPVCKHIKSVPWEYGEIIPDFVLGKTCCALFLSLKYHALHPDYIYRRVSELGTQYGLRLLMIVCDVSNPKQALQELTKMGVVKNLTIIVAANATEAGRYLESYKSLENAAPTGIQGHASTAYQDQVVDVLTAVRAVNKSDAQTLISTFGSLKNALNASAEEMQTIIGWGPRKVQNLMTVLHMPFRSDTGTNRKRQAEMASQAVEQQQRRTHPGADHSASRAVEGLASEPVAQATTESMAADPLFLADDDEEVTIDDAADMIAEGARLRQAEREPQTEEQASIMAALQAMQKQREYRPGPS
jgi:DNA excision repair protein ERCC-1